MSNEDKHESESPNRRELMRRAAGWMLTITLVDLMPTRAYGVAPPTCTDPNNDPDEGCGTAHEDQTCHVNNAPDRGCSQTDPDENCQPGSFTVSHDQDQSCGSMALDKPVEADSACGTTRDQGDADGACGRVNDPNTGMPYPDWGCSATDRDDSCIGIAPNIDANCTGHVTDVTCDDKTHSVDEVCTQNDPDNSCGITSADDVCRAGLTATDASNPA